MTLIDEDGAGVVCAPGAPDRGFGSHRCHACFVSRVGCRALTESAPEACSAAIRPGARRRVRSDRGCAPRPTIHYRADVSQGNRRSRASSAARVSGAASHRGPHHIRPTSGSTLTRLGDEHAKTQLQSRLNRERPLNRQEPFGTNLTNNVAIPS